MAWLLTIITKPIIVIYTCIHLHNISAIGKWYLNIADIEDNAGNVRGQYLWNAIFITKDGYKFGNPTEKMSVVLAKNYILGKLILPGKFLCWLLIKWGDPTFALLK